MYKKYFKSIGIFFAVLISVSIFIFRDRFINLQEIGLLGLFILSILGNATIILPVPVVLTAFVAGSVFNPIVVSVVVAAGASIGELTGYLAGVGGSEVVEDNKKLQRVKTWMDRYGLWTIFILAAIPNPFFDLAGIVAGAYKISVPKYLVAVFFGKIIKFGVISYLGSEILI